MTRLAVRRGAYLRAYAVDFIERFAQGFTRADIEKALQTDVVVWVVNGGRGLRPIRHVRRPVRAAPM